MRPSAAIQTHPSRLPRAERLAALVGAELVVDPEPGSPVRSPWRTYREALASTPPAATHRLVVQDDVQVCDHFAAVWPQAVAAHPDAVMCFFVQGIYPYAQRVYEACDRDQAVCDLAPDRWVPVVATCWPTWAIEPMLGWVEEQRWGEQFRADDEIMGRAARHLGLKVYATVPSLVEHPDEVPSIGGNRRAMAGLDASRVAACFIADGDARLVDWASGPPS